MSAPRSWSNKEYSCLDFLANSMFKFYFEIAWVLVSPRMQVQPQIILGPDYLPDFLSVSYD